jgi:hypothetical protein
MRRSTLALAAITILALLIALPVLAAKPSAPPGQAKDKVEKSPITLHGTIQSSTAADGETSYTLTDGGKTYTLEAGPKWFFGDKHPLKPYVGKSVTVEGEVAAGSTDVDVSSVDGVALRAPGKPPWAGGWKQVGKIHPGWSQDKADRFQARLGGCWPPGHCKDKLGPGASGEPAGE